MPKKSILLVLLELIKRGVYATSPLWKREDGNTGLSWPIKEKG
jgi:hypothetical protein